MSRAPITHGSGTGLTREQGGEGSLREVLAWQRAVLSAATVPELLVAASLPPGASAAMTATLLLSDPTHELRHLLFGDERAPADAGVLFCDSLVAIAPQFAFLSDPWRGTFRASEHGVLFPGATGVESVILFPLRSSGALIGCLSLGAGYGVRVPGEGDPWVLAHVGDIMSVAVGRLLDGMRLRRGGFTNPVSYTHLTLPTILRV